MFTRGVKLTKQEITLLDLKPGEVRLINVLEASQTGLDMAAMQKQLALPRTTLSSELHRLQERGLVRAERKGRSNVWHAALGSTLLRQSTASWDESFAEVRVYEGVEEIKELYRRALAVRQEERVTIVEGKQAVNAIGEKAGITFIESWHTVALERKLIMESLFSEDTIRRIQAGEIAPRIIKSLQRFVLWVGFVVPDNVINTNSALILFRHSLILVDWNKERGVYVENREIVTLMRHMIEVYKSQARQVNLVKLVNQV